MDGGEKSARNAGFGPGDWAILPLLMQTIGHVSRMVRSVRVLLALLTAGVASVAASGGVPGREPNSTLRVPLVPGGFGYRFVDALGLSVEAPVAVVTPPGETNRLFIVEQRGRISVVTNLAAPTRTVFLDLVNRTVYQGEQGLLGLAFHPQYARNGRFFVFRTQRTGPDGVRVLHDVLSEFRVSAANPHAANPNSEIQLFRQHDEASNHNGGDLHFGPDGYLYVSVGDEGGGNDNYGNSQRIDRELFAGILRLDVDRRPGSLPPNRNLNNPAELYAYTTNYSVPADNPFVGATEFLKKPVDPTRVRTEFWSVGLRNPWRMSFDRPTGELWVGDVGQNAVEMVTLSRAGANHGWAFREGRLSGPKAGAPVGFLTDPVFNFVAPLHTYPHGSGPTRGNSITGGLVYRGHRLAQLHGAYVFADYISGNVWALRRREGQAPLVTRLIGQNGISAFGTDPRQGDLLACHLDGGRILRLEYDPNFSGDPLPPTLVDTGAFSDLATLTPNPGVVPYSVNLPFWSDGAAKQRWFCVPATNQLLNFTTHEAWEAPVGTVWVKHFSLELTNGIPSSARRLETRFLVRNGNGVHGITYRWNSATNAALVSEEGEEELIARRVDGRVVTQVWRYPGRAECLTCHTPRAGYSLSFNTPQLLREEDYLEGRTNQVLALAAAGYFANTPPPIRSLPALVPPSDEESSVESRARSWLAVNCSSCHRTGGTGGGFLDLRLEIPTSETGILLGPLSDQRGDPANRVLIPGDHDHSQLLARISARGPGQMPPLASVAVDPAGVAIIRQWIDELGDPSPVTQEFLSASREGDLLRLEVRQPANRRLQLQSSPALDGATWEWVDVPGNEPFYPARLREFSIELPANDGGYFRLRPTGP